MQTHKSNIASEWLYLVFAAIVFLLDTKVALLALVITLGIYLLVFWVQHKQRTPNKDGSETNDEDYH